MHEAFHHDLTGERTGDCAALAAREERNGKQRAAERGAEQRRECEVRHTDPVAVGSERNDLSAGDRHGRPSVEHGRREHEDRGVDQEGERERDGGVECV